MQIEAELVTQANARLFPAVTSLQPVTYTGAANAIPSPDGQKIVYAVTQSSEDANKGLWILGSRQPTPIFIKKTKADCQKYHQARLLRRSSRLVAGLKPIDCSFSQKPG